MGVVRMEQQFFGEKGSFGFCVFLGPDVPYSALSSRHLPVLGTGTAA